MVRTETLQAILSAKESISKHMRAAADGTREARDAMGEAAAASAALSSSLGLSEEQADNFRQAIDRMQDETLASASSLRQLRQQYDEVGDDAAGSVPPLSEFNSEVQDTIDDAAAAAAATESFESRISESGDELRDARNAMASASAASAGLTSGLGLSEDQADDFRQALASMQDETIASASSLRQLRQEYDEVGDDAAGSIPPLSAFNSEVQDTIDNAAAAAAATHAFQSRIDEAGEEATLAALKSSGLSAAMLAVGSSSGAASAALTAFNASATTTLTVTAGVVAALAGLATALGGIAVAAAAAGGALAAIFAGGLLAKGEQLAAQSSEIEGAWEGVQEIFSRIGDAATEALAPLQQAEFTAFAMEGLEGAVNLLNYMAIAVARVADPLMRVADTVAAAFWDQTPRFFAELEATVLEFLPILENIGEWFATAIPDALGVMRSAASRLAPSLGSLVNALTDALPPIIEIGVRLARVVIPPLTVAIEIFGALISVLNTLTAPLDTILPLWKTLGDSVSSVVGGLEYLVDSLVSARNSMSSGLRDMIPYTNEIVALANAAWEAAGALGAMGQAMQGGVKGAFGGLGLAGLGLALIPGFGWAAAGGTVAVSTLLGATNEVANSGSGSKKNSSSGQGSLTLRERTQQIRQRAGDTNINVDVDASGSTQSSPDIERTVQDAVKKALKAERERESGLPN